MDGRMRGIKVDLVVVTCVFVLLLFAISFSGLHGLSTISSDQYGISRAMQDSLAVDSHRRAANAIAKSYFKEQILPIPVEAKRGIEELPSLIAMNTRRGRSSLYGCWAGPCGPKKHWNVRDSRSIK